MKKIIAMLAAIAVAPVANAGDTDFSWDGESRTRFEHLANTNFTEVASQEDVKQRTKLGLTAKKGESWTGRVTLIHNYDFGSDSGDGNTSGVQQSALVSDNALLVNEVYFNWKANDSWTFQAGRRGMLWADGAVVGLNDFETTPTSVDGVSAFWDHDMFTAEFTWNKVEEETTNSGVRAADPEQKFWGAAVDFKGLGDYLKTTHVHVLSHSRDELSAGTTTGFDLLRYGVTLGGGAMGLTYNLTYAGYTGDSFQTGAAAVDMTGSMIDAKLGYSIAGVDLGVGYHTDSGSSDATKVEKYQDFISTTHGRAGKMDILAWGNLTSINLNAAYAFNDGSCKVAVDYWIFTQTEENDSTNGGVNGTAINGTDLDGEDALGSEIDVAFTHTYDNGMELLARVGMFMPGDEFGTSDETYTQYFLQGTMPF